jgi:hypothetical protein
MNISTGGPHILLFERDQQLAVLLTSEFQLAGYECHTARTAVEVFDAIARYPIKIVLVNVAQAAAARREFWVALDSQRRGRGVQVLTIRCTNIAGYGPHDSEDRSQAMVDVEIDGMLGIVNLIDTVRARIPGNGVKANTGTMPRMPRMATPAPPTQMPPSPSTISRTTAPQYSPSLNTLFNNNTSNSIARPSANDMLSSSPPSPHSSVQPPPSTPAAHMASTMPTSPLADTPSEAMSSGTSTYTDKIRAVLYPNQRVWTPQGNSAASTPTESRATYEPSSYAPTSPPMPSAPAEATTLQRLANGQIGTEGQQESGLAQLSRMLQERQSSQQHATDYPIRNTYSYQATELQQTEGPSFPAPNISQSSTSAATMHYATQAPVRPTPAAESPVAPVNYAAPAPARPTQAPEPPTGSTSYASPAPARPAYSPETTTGSITHTAPPEPARPVQAPEHTTISAQPLRASPIQDIPAERPVSGHSNTEGARRTEAMARAAYGQPPQTPAAIPPLASIAAQPAPQPVKPPPVPEPAVEAIEEGQTYITEEPEEETLHQISGELVSNEKVKNKVSVPETTISEEALLISELGAEADLGLSPNNALLLDIMQSLPPMPPAPPQPSQVQPQVLNGRATRTLNSVLLEGHLVPQNRLEVAQRIQRMLRGVDLNYQLGEILLMFKLLTPDQLLAASLVSYGMITTAQISALGRIRQELHAIGLEYDLENLVILFRILTPEQLREVRSSWQG